MNFVGWTEADFEVFEVPGLEPRMAALKERVRPKLEQLGEDFAPLLSEWLGRPMYAHVAKHARRTVNPPADSWVAFSTDRRGYKKHPHFQIGIWPTHLFAVAGVIWETPHRAAIAQRMRAAADEILARLPVDYWWYPDHTQPDGIPAAEVDRARLVELLDRLASRRDADLLAGIRIERGEALALSPQAFEARVRTCFETLLPLYRLAAAEEVQA